MNHRLVAGLVAALLFSSVGCTGSGAPPEIFTVECTPGAKVKLDLPGRTIADLVGIQAVGEFPTPQNGVIGAQTTVEFHDGSVYGACSIEGFGSAQRLFFSVPAL